MPSAAESAVLALYQNRAYPSMSHPASDPAVSAVAARLGGLSTVHPSRSRILEIGCASGHNLLPLARRWPRAHLLGMDLAAGAIEQARELAVEAGVANASFVAADLRCFDPGPEPFDFIIAHGVFSWVPDEVKLALLDFCARHLAPSGIATVSFNLTDGWAARQPVIALVRRLLPVTGGDVIATLEMVRATLDPATPHGAMNRWVIDDMLAKGRDILLFDDFGPVNDPWPFEGFVQAAARAGLRWLGDSDPGENLPSVLGPDSRAALAEFAHSPLHTHLAADFASGRAFRSGVLCRADAPVVSTLTAEVLDTWSARAGTRTPSGGGPLAEAFYQLLRRHAPACVPVPQLRAALPDAPPDEFAEILLDGIARGLVRPRVEPVACATGVPERPALHALARACVRRGLPVVDCWHLPCLFPAAQQVVLAALDGSRTVAQLREFAAANSPGLAVDPWLQHLAGRGIFC